MVSGDKQARESLFDRQRERLNRMLAEVLPRHRFYRDKLGDDVQIRDRHDLERLPLTTKDELVSEQAAHPPYGRLLTYGRERYTRLHQTSGSQGTPLRWLDTAESWNCALDCWAQMFRMIGVTSADRLLFAFSFGPFLGFWTAFESASRLGCLCFAAGGMSSGARLRMLLDNEATILLCTPTYALHLAQVAQEQGIRLDRTTPGYGIRALIVAGEPGGSIPATRQRLEAAWQARVFDHSGMTEIGPLAIECEPAPGGLHVMEEDYIAEVLEPDTLRPVVAGEIGELVLTNLGRWGSPLIRYRTADLVRVDPQPCRCGSDFMRLAGGILGRTDDMIAIRGNNFYPSALEEVVRRFAEVVEYRVEVDTSAALAELRVELEAGPNAGPELPGRVAQAIRDELMFRAEVLMVPSGSLPRYEMKARRVSRRQ